MELNGVILGCLCSNGMSCMVPVVVEIRGARVFRFKAVHATQTSNRPWARESI